MEFYELRFSGLTAALMRAWFAFRTSVVAMTACMGLTLLAATKILGPTVGLGRLQTILLVVPVAFACILLSEYQGVVVTAVMMSTLVLLVSLPCMGAAELWPHLREAGADRELAHGLLLKHLLPAGAMGLVAARILA